MHYTSLPAQLSGVKRYTNAVRRSVDTPSVGQSQVTQRPFSEELPVLLKERDESLRSLARAVGGIDHSYLSRMVAGQTAVNPQHASRIAVYLGLPTDYFPEVREAAVIAAIRERPQLRDRIYFKNIRTRSSV